MSARTQPSLGLTTLTAKKTQPSSAMAPDRFPVPTSGGGYSAVVLADSPLLYLPMDGATAADASGNGRVASLVGGTWITGEPPLISTGNSWKETGSQYIQYNSASWWQTAQTTLEAWIKPTDVSWSQIMDSDFSTRRFQFRVYSSRFDFIWWTTSGPFILTAGPTVTANTTYHVVATVDAAGLGTLYVNGASVGTLQGTAGSMPAGNFLVVGGGGGGGGSVSYYFKGWIDEVAVYATALSAARILAHYQARV